MGRTTFTWSSHLADLIGQNHQVDATARRTGTEGKEKLVLPASFAQQGLWVLHQLCPQTCAYNMPVAIRILGDLDVSALERSLAQIARRHETLRTTFKTVDRQLMQLIAPAGPVTLPCTDLRRLGSVERAQEEHRLITEEAWAPFDLSLGPLMRVRLFRTGELEYALVRVQHHIISDDWSDEIFLGELITAYEALIEGCRPQMPELQIQYGDYSQRQREFLRGESLARQLEYWRSQLADLPEIELLGAHPRPTMQTSSSGEESFELTPELSDALRNLGASEHATLFVTLLTAFKVLLMRYSGQEDIVVGAPIANRGSTETEHLIGLFVNPVVMRTKLEGDPPFRLALRRVRQTVLGALEHADLPFVRLAEELAPTGSANRNPFFQVMFDVIKAQPRERRMGGSNLVPIDIEKRCAMFELMVELTEGMDAIRGSLNYSRDLFDASTMRCMATRFRTLLEGIAAQPDARLSELPLLTSAERRQLVVEWNNTDRDYPANVGLHQLIEAQADRTPDAIAVVYQDEFLTYREVNRRANQVAHRLRKLGVGPDTIVGIFAERSIEMIIGLLATLKAGGAYLPLDPSYPADRLAFMLEDAQPAVVLVQSRLRSLLPRHVSKFVFLEDDFAAESDVNPVNITNPENLAYVIYTSGSTGRPKGVMNTHCGICNRLLWMQETYELTMDDRVLQKTPFTFDVSVWEFFWPLLTGAQLVVARPRLHGDSQYLIKVICENAITTLHFVPSMLAIFLEDKDAERCSSLRRVISSGEALHFELQERFFSTLSDTQLHNLYGPTEAAVDVTFWKCQRGSGESIVPIGRPVANTQLYILGRTMQPVPPSVPGELHIGGVQLARGYLARPDLTAEKFVQNPFGEGRLYKTGDLARYRTDGAIEFLGRIDQQVKLRGQRIELGEIEAVFKKHKAVRDCVVVTRQESRQIDKRLVAYVVAGGTSQQDLRLHALKMLPDYMVPSTVVFLQEFPLTANGKLDRRALPAPALVHGEKGPVPPRDALETRLVSIWEKVLAIQPIGITDDFFELGGHSLLAVRMANRLRELVDERVSVALILQFPTIEKLAEELEKNFSTNSAIGRISRLARTEGADEVVLPSSFAQQGLWLIDQLRPQSCDYNIPLAFRIHGRLDVDALARSFSFLVRRHEVLRTTFRAVDGNPMQIIAPALEVTLPVADLRGLDSDERASRARKLIEDEASMPFDLAQGPLIRTKLLRKDEKEHVLMMNLHHIIDDDWSHEILMHELLVAYQAFAESRKPELPELPIQYGDYAHWQREQRDSKRFNEQLQYWRGQLSDLTELELPVDRPRSGAQTASAANEPIELSIQATHALKSLSQSEGATFFMTMLAAFQVLLARYTGQEDIVVGSPVANRGHGETEPLIGYFINTLVLRTKLDGDPTFREMVRRVRGMTLEAYQNQDLPFELVVEALATKRDLGRNPLYQVMFNLLKAGPKSYPLEDLRLVPIEIEDRTAKFDLTMMLFDNQDGLRGHLNYNAELFDSGTMRCMARHFRTLIEGIVANPEARISELPLFDNAERNKILFEWNDTCRDYPKDVRLHELIEAQVQRIPDAVAVVFEDQQLTYREVNRRANQLAHRLRKLGVGPDSIVGIFAERSLEMIVGLLATLKAGGAYLPLDPNYPAERLAFMLGDAQPAVVLVQSRLRSVLPEQVAKVIILEDDFVAESDMNPVDITKPENLAYVIYTSGSTGRPKGVMNTHRGICNWLLWLQETCRLTEDDRLMHKTPFTFDLSLGEIFLSLIAGSQLIVAQPGLHGDSRYLTKTICEKSITVICFVPSTLSAFLEDQHVARCSSVRLVICGGESLAVELHERLLAVLPDAELHNIYGPTEAAVAVTHWQCQRGSGGRFEPIGRPVANTQIYILDRAMQLMPNRVPGELHIGGVQVARGYLARPELTGKAFVPNPFGEGRLYKTGDLARYREDGAIEFLGRLDQQVKLRGQRIELGEIEAVLKKHEAVRDCVVVMRQEGIETQLRLIAYVVASRLSLQELCQHAQRLLPDYMVPSAVVFLQELPLTASGKLDRRALPQPAIAHGEKGPVPPRDALETQLVAIWEKVLGIQPIGITDNFFQIGGNSLLAVRVFAEVERTLGKRLPLAALFEMPTVETLAPKVRQATRPEDWGPVVAIQMQGARPPFFVIHGRDGNVLLFRKFSQLLAEEQPFFGLQAQGLDGSPIVRTSVESIASYYLEKMREIQPHGPYFLGGYSFGGLAAYEIALHLRAAGEEVALLMLFDTHNPAHAKRVRSWMQVVRQMVRRGITAKRMLEFLAGQARGKLGDRLTEWNEALHRLPLGRAANREGARAAELVDMHVQMVHERAFLAYSPQPYHGKVTLFRTFDQDSAFEMAEDLGWGGVVQGGVDVHYLPGSHLTIFSDENVPTLARKVEECIQSVLSKGK